MHRPARPSHLRSLPNHLAKHALAIAIGVTALLAIAVAPPSARAQATQPGIRVPKEMTPIMPFNQVRIGMKGYGLTVYHGVKIEPFAVEVISIQQDFSPKRGVIWIRCPDERMQKSGPVHGMSGSPIFLWGEGEPQTLGKGGKLIGAFAYGFGATKDCYAGVQPIEGMRDAGQRALDPAAMKPKSANAGDPTGSVETSAGGTMLDRLMEASWVRKLPESQTWRARRLQEFIRPAGAQQANAQRHGARGAAGDTSATDRTFELAPGVSGRMVRLMAPLAVRSQRLASELAPLLEPMGLTPVQTPMGASAGQPPPGIDGAKVQIEPGSVLSIPLAWGDADMSGVGTATEVLPDGRVLGFGHPMFGQGDADMPMASGYIHMVMPGLISSFKLGGSARLQGAIVRDEFTAVVGRPDHVAPTANARVTVIMPGYKPTEFNYQLARHKAYTALLSAVVAAESISAVQDPPMENTARLSVRMTFDEGRHLEFESLIPDSNASSVVMQLLPIAGMMAQNPFRSVLLKSLDVRVEFEPRSRAASMVSAKLERAAVAPGDTANITLKLQPFGKAPVMQRIAIAIPEDLEDGDYPIHITDAMNYVQHTFSARPHLQQPTSLDELQQLIDRVMATPNNAVYALFQTSQSGLAVGKQELPRLPSSRRVMIATPSNTLTTPFSEMVETTVPTEWVPEGDLQVIVSVKKALKND